ncbi:bacteriocin [Neisseria sp.]|uniref:bacteriocin n=1 Tax=Neisseria sp. TaxID=192066 RepID=UPI0026DAD818|nr:bacteriocin [Neisseria sp.]MDO4907983.1 bacteriocin [Neisseria sp.]
MKVLSSQELNHVSGGLVLNAVGGIAGGIGGHFGYLGGALASGTYNRNAHLAAIGLGAVGGAANPVRGVGSALAKFGSSVAVTGAGLHR